MARKRISEFRAKTLLYQELGVPYTGIQVTNKNLPLFLNSQFSTLNSDQYVVKVDQGVKGRFKKGLVLLNQTAEQLPRALEQLKQKGYSQFLIEEMTSHEPSDEKYLSIERVREGYKIFYSKTGGVNIEESGHVKQIIIPYSEDYSMQTEEIDSNFLRQLLKTFDTYYFSFLEINPYIILDTKYLLLDAAVEVDSTAAFFVNNAWTEKDFTDGSIREKTPEEKNVQKLAENSQAAFSLEVLNPNGSIFMMLSGGGASIVLADEVYNEGYGKELANYGEYSGNPNAEETYIYAKNLLSLLLRSIAKKKVLIIAGGVANFTDVRITFKGLIKALDEVKTQLQTQNIQVFVRRGGPYQEEGLQLMKQFLEQNHLLGVIAGPEMVLTDIITKATQSL